MQALGLFLLCLGIILSVRQRRYFLMYRSLSTSSPLSNAVAELVGTAGGIYLSLELLFSFLQLPDNWWSDTTFVVEPLAAVSLVLAIIQPFVQRVWLKIRK